ncbi:MAG: 5'-methylthioadenosine/adenosylhomocysteine nucleosidase [Clostridia bacterium]|nr:5'-methylthioadenosine/adenosylhomocysteine nucleosidase [Clostridia bacterium]
MKKIGIIAAMEEEKNAIKNIMKNIKENKIYELIFTEGTINEEQCVLVESGVGKVNSSRTTQIMIDKYDIKYIINVGSAGSLVEELNIGDIVIGRKIIQHDFDITAFGHKKGYISNIGECVLSDEKLINKFEKILKEIDEKEIKTKIGTIATGDIFCTETKMKNKIKEKFNADAIEMEAASIAQVCYLDKIPFIILRSISDTPNGKNKITFEEYLELASKRCAEMLEKFI